MYKIMIHIDTHTNDTWFYYQEEGKDYVANSLEEIRETVLTLIDVYGEDYIKIVKQETGDDMSGSVETFLYDSTDNYEELVNRPFINGVEIVGELSLAELGIQPEGNYATNERVDQVEAKVDAIDLEPYATMDYLDEVVAGIDFSASNENITGVKTFSVLPRSTVVPVAEDELTNKAYVDHEVFGCATEEYVDEAIANIQIPVFEVAALGAVQYDAYMTEEEGKRFLEYCNEHYNEFIQVYLYCPTSSLSGIYSGTPVANDWGNGIFKLYSNATGYKSGIIYDTHLYVSADMTEDGKFDTTQGCRPYIHCGTVLNVSANYLSRTNTREYTPTTAYHPATKKYVDDAVAANAGTTIYSELTDKPSINNVVLEGNKTLKELGIDSLPHLHVSAPLQHPNLHADLLDSQVLILQEALNAARNRGSVAILVSTNNNGAHILRNGTATKAQSTNRIVLTSSAEPINDTTLRKFSLVANITWASDGSSLTVNSAYLQYTDILTNINQIMTKDNAIEYTPTADYHPATKKYVDDVVSTNTGPSMNIFEFMSPLDLGTMASYNSPHVDIWDDIAEQFGQAMLKASNTDGKLIIIVNFPDFETNGYGQSTTIFQERFVFLQKQDQIIVDDTLRYYTFGSQVVSNTHNVLKDLPEVSPMRITCGIQLDVDGTIKLQDYHFTLWYEPNRFLSSNNTNAFTPTKDYHPATKKYVDDAVANIDVPDVDLTDYYNKTEVDNKINEMLSSAITSALESEY